ncbi:MAG TPA: hypothetical protein VG605_10390 [Puia sp.]|nr:hypothetical protein [Puia sp.]
MAPAFETVLIVDEMPMIAAGFHEILKSLHPAVQVEHVGNVFTALSARDYENKRYDLIVLGSGEDPSPGSLLLSSAELKQRFPGARILVYTDKYDPILMDKIGEGLIDACVHKYEDLPEVHNALLRLQHGESFLSPMLQTLYTLYQNR